MPRITSGQLEIIETGKVGKAEAGRRAHRGGLDFENQLAGQHKAYELAGVALIDRLELPTAPAPVQMRGKTVMMRRATGNAPYDFTGCLSAASPFPGRKLAMEAKRTKDRPKTIQAWLPVKNELTGTKQGLGRNQLERLLALDQAGALVALVWKCADRIGVANGMDLQRVKRRVLTEGVERVLEADLHWLRPGDSDWLNPLLDAATARVPLGFT